MPINIILINGPNLNLLGTRETSIYGHISFEDYFIKLQAEFSNINLSYFQSNHEGAIIDKLQEVSHSVNGIILNAAAYSHTSIAIMDTIKAITCPVVEVHISDIMKRELFRQHSYISLAAAHVISGEGMSCYEMAIKWLIQNN